MPHDLFDHVPPTDVTQPKYDAIRAAEDATQLHLKNVWDLSMRKGHLSPAHFSIVRRAARELHAVIMANAPMTADTSTALRCARHCCMLANEAISRQDPDLMRRALNAATDARMWACAAIAHHSTD